MTESQLHNPMALRGMVTSPHYLASLAGLDMLRRGGTAVDAALSAAAVLAVVYPQMCSLGGDCFWLIFNAEKGELRGLNGSGRAGERLSRKLYADRGLSAVPSRGPLAAITVPGLVSGWAEAHAYARKSMGSAISWEGCLAEARELAERGFPVSAGLAGWLAADTDTGDREQRFLQRFPGFAKTFLPGGRVPRLGEVFRQPDLARSLALLAEKGPEDFYEGELAERIVRGLNAAGGLLTARDFAGHRSDWVTPISVGYGRYRVCNLPPSTQGISSLQILAMAEAADLRRLPEGSADWCHFLVEATKLAFADRDRFVTDPDFAEIPVEKLLSESHARACAARVDGKRAGSFTSLLDPAGDTVWLGAVDGRGNAVSLIQSVYNDFGSGLVPEGTGIVLQNRGSFFSLDPDHANRLEPGKRTMHTLNPPMILENGRPYLVYGTMGGEGQPQTQAALVTRMLDYGMTPQAAVDAPRWLYGRSWGEQTNSLLLESRFPDRVFEDLAARGHRVERAPAYCDRMGHAGAILIDRVTGLLRGASDPRSDGLACGF